MQIKPYVFCACLKVHIFGIILQWKIENDLATRCRNLDIKGRNMAFPRSFGHICSEFPWHYCVVSGLKIAHTWSNTAPVCIKFWQHWVSLPNSKAFGILRKSVQTIVICQHSPTNTAVSWHFDARIPLEALLCGLPKSFVFNRCHHRNYLSTNDLVN